MRRKNETRNTEIRPRRKRRTLLVILLSLLLLIAIIALLLPVIMLKYANRQLHNLKEYTGNIESLNMNLVNGTYVVRDFIMMKKDENGKKDTTPFMKVSRTDLTLDWGALIKGKIAAKVIITEPIINYTYEIIEDKEIKQDTTDFRELIRKLMPISLNRFEIVKGEIHYVDESKKPVIDLAVKDLYVIATNLTNVQSTNKKLPANVTANANIYDGSFDLNMNLDPLAKQPTFDMKTEIKNMNLGKFNQFFETYGNFSVKKGSFSMYGEFAGKEGEFGGYVKPFIHDFEVKKYKEDDDLSQRIWEILVGTTMKILENKKTENVATRVPVNGKFQRADVNIWQAIHYVLRNAFVQALRPTLENSISINHMESKDKETFLEKVFSGDKKEERKEKREEKKK